jgi:uncharacterized protein (TIGR03086 family)
MTETDTLDQFARASAWTLVKVEGATTHLDASTPCDGWDVRTLLNHMLETQRYFVSAANGEDATMPTGLPEEGLGENPTATFAAVRNRALRAFGDEAHAEAQQSLLPIAVTDTLVHGWDVARATGQDTRMPDGLAEAALSAIEGKLSHDQRGTAFAPELRVPEGSSAQDRLLAYTGRIPA